MYATRANVSCRLSSLTIDWFNATTRSAKPSGYSATGASLAEAVESLAVSRWANPGTSRHYLHLPGALSLVPTRRSLWTRLYSQPLLLPDVWSNAWRESSHPAVNRCPPTPWRG